MIQTTNFFIFSRQLCGSEELRGFNSILRFNMFFISRSKKTRQSILKHDFGRQPRVLHMRDELLSLQKPGNIERSRGTHGQFDPVADREIRRLRETSIRHCAQAKALVDLADK